MDSLEVGTTVKLPLVIAVWLGCPLVGWGQTAVDFNRDIRPLLSDRCFQCHGPDEHDRQGELRLDQATGEQGAYRVIERGSAEQSELWRRINAEGDEAMPPLDANKKPLTTEERARLKAWLDAGAPYADFWAFVPPRRPELPDPQPSAWGEHPLDRLVQASLREEGLTPQPRADRRTLIRRLSLDLTGLPPTREEVQAFLEDNSPDAYERLVDRLLAKPHYGEHLTKYWLDLVRFADTNGIHHDHYREMTPYRDWLIRAFNDNLPYDQFVRYQLAGDLFPDPSRDQLIASGFNRLHLIIDVGTALPEESYTRNVIDRVTAFGTAFMGLTVQCAVCHDHKYDPITMQDFYQLFAFFNNLDATPETGGRRGPDFRRGLQPPYISLATEQQTQRLQELTQLVQEAQAHVQVAQKSLKELPADPADRRAAVESELKQWQTRLQQAQADKTALEDEVSYAMVMRERPDPRPAYILIRGAYDKPGNQVQRNTPGFLPPLPSSVTSPTRMDLANWLVAPDHPLTARVAVNRFWQQLFGVGLVKTSEDFGAQGTWPSHPQVLDYLAVEFVASGWDIKALFKQIVMSQTYQQASAAPSAAYQQDPENRWLARGSRFRLDSEVIRDQILATSGLLNPELYGKSVKPPQPDGLWKAVSMPSSYPRTYEADAGGKIYRRSLYTFWKRGMPPPQMTILNAPTREACIARRERTNTPLQALLLMNERQFLEASRHLARRLLADSTLTDVQRVSVAYETITCQVPDDDERQRLMALLNDLQAMYARNRTLAEKLNVQQADEAEATSAELAAWTVLVSTLYNLDVTKTRS